MRRCRDVRRRFRLLQPNVTARHSRTGPFNTCIVIDGSARPAKGAGKTVITSGGVYNPDALSAIINPSCPTREDVTDKD
ncbi:MAG: hypothetical protein IPM55_12420 [Acidobacteria bacterium]|nr:hypothetical protein [Acidobacteriota bacterium]